MTDNAAEETIRTRRTTHTQNNNRRTHEQALETKENTSENKSGRNINEAITNTVYKMQHNTQANEGT